MAATRVFVTIDTEFSIGGAFTSPATLIPIGPQNVLCAVDGRSEGLGFMLNALALHGLRATFFLEALQSAYFGDGPMGEVAARLRDAGHDVQLHLHPVWTYFDQLDWPQRLDRQPPNDDLHGRSVEQLSAWMQRGIDTFARWGVARPVALRTGNLMVDRNIYRAMAQIGFRVASNVARAVFEPAEPALRFNGGMHCVEGILELPVLTYADLRLGRRTHRKALTITGASLAETRCLLERAHAADVPCVVLLTHCHEFVKGNMRGRLRTNVINQKRLAGLCRYLAQNSDRFEVATMGDVARAEHGASSADPLLTVPLPLAMMRIAQNKLNELNLV